MITADCSHGPAAEAPIAPDAGDIGLSGRSVYCSPADRATDDLWPSRAWRQCRGPGSACCPAPGRLAPSDCTTISEFTKTAGTKQKGMRVQLENKNAIFYFAGGIAHRPAAAPFARLTVRRSGT